MVWNTRGPRLKNEKHRILRTGWSHNIRNFKPRLMATASSASLKLMRAEIKFLPPSPRRRRASAPFVLAHSLARSLRPRPRDKWMVCLMVEHHVNKFGPRRWTEGCLLLIFGLRAASKESRRGDEERGRLAFRQRCLAYTRIAPQHKDHLTKIIFRSNT